MSAEDLVYNDTARGLNLNGRDKFRERTEAWAKAFSDARIVNPSTLTLETLSSPGLPPKAQTTGYSVRSSPRTSDLFAVLRNLPLRQARADCVGRLLLDQYTLLTQLEHIQPLAAAA
jgi:hypothetical protein